MTSILVKEVKTEQNLENNKRDIKLDIARTFAILCVILCHSCEAMSINDVGNYVIISLLHTFSRLGVPIFLFLSGTLLLRKNINYDNDVKHFYKNNLIPLLIVNFIWIILYNLFFYFTGQKEFVNISNFIKELFFLKQVPTPNMWYFPMIIGVYLGIPFIAKIVKNFSIESIKYVLMLLLIANFIIPEINISLRVLGVKEYFNLLLNLQFFGGVYGLYIILGYYMYTNNKHRIDIKWIILFAVASFCCAFIKRFIIRDIWYNSLSILICGSCIYILFNMIKEERINNKIGAICTYISKISLALFFVHYIIQKLVYVSIEQIPVESSVKCIILYAIVTMFSILIIKILSKFKFISKYVLLIK